MMVPYGLVLESCVGAIFLIAGSMKLASPSADFSAFLQSIGVPASLTIVGSYLVPVGEIIVGVALFLHISKFFSWAALAFSLAFVVSLSLRKRRTGVASCRCFGMLDGRHDTNPMPIYRATTLVGLSALLPLIWVQESGSTSLWISPEKWMGILGAVVVVAFFTLLGRVYAFRNFRRELLAHQESFPASATHDRRAES
jgi:uncharacterized membrane protein YphA (DoxX/SURF4 family)